MSAIETWTVGKLLTWTTDYLKRAGSTSPRLDAEVLLAHARGCQRIELYTAFDQEPSEETRAAFREMVKKRAEGMPVAYLVGYKEFYSLTFEVTPDVLIPRPETEHLVVEALDVAKALSVSTQGSSARHAEIGTRGEPLHASPWSLHIAEVGTGSGAIAVALLKHLPQARLTAVDISPAALEVAKCNASRHGIDENRITFVEGNLLAWCQPSEQFDMIVSNPPYVSLEEFDQLPKTVRDFEPRTALVSEPSGGTVIAQLIEHAENHLRPGGYLIFEFSPMLESHLSGLIAHPEKWSEPKITKDLAGHARVVTLRIHRTEAA